MQRKPIDYPTNIPPLKDLNVNDIANALQNEVWSKVPRGFSEPPINSQPLPSYIPQRKPMVPPAQGLGPNTPLYGGMARGGIIPRHLATGGTSTYGLSSVPMLPVNPPSVAQPNSSTSPYVADPMAISKYIAPVNSHGIPTMPTSSPPIVTTNPNIPSLNGAYNLFAPGANRGGAMHMASGGMPSAPWYTRREASDEEVHPKGLFNGPNGGRTDTLNKIVPAGAYVLPADVVSGLGEGNTMAGANVLDAMMHSLPFGIKGGRSGGGGMGIPRAPAAFKAKRGGAAKYADGGKTDKDWSNTADDWDRQAQAHQKQVIDQGRGKGEVIQWDLGRYNDGNPVESKRGGAPKGGGHVPVVVAGGEYLVSPEHVQALGNGNLRDGHRVLDHFVVHVRNKTADEMKKLPGPKK